MPGQMGIQGRLGAMQLSGGPLDSQLHEQIGLTVNYLGQLHIQKAIEFLRGAERLHCQSLSFLARAGHWGHHYRYKSPEPRKTYR
jgi:hypothetical protein